MIEDYDFVKYDSNFIAHLGRHFLDSNTAGSRFRGRLTTRDIIDFAYAKLDSHYNGAWIVRIETLPYVIGDDAVIPVARIPIGIEIETQMRDGKHAVRVVRGIRKKPTSDMVIIAGPLEHKPEKHGFLSIYPGRYCPQFGEVNATDFWKRHAFIID